DDLRPESNSAMPPEPRPMTSVALCAFLPVKLQVVMPPRLTPLAPGEKPASVTDTASRIGEAEFQWLALEVRAVTWMYCWPLIVTKDFAQMHGSGIACLYEGLVGSCVAGSQSGINTGVPDPSVR